MKMTTQLCILKLNDCVSFKNYFFIKRPFLPNCIYNNNSCSSPSSRVSSTSLAQTYDVTPERDMCGDRCFVDRLRLLHSTDKNEVFLLYCISMWLSCICHERNSTFVYLLSGMLNGTEYLSYMCVLYSKFLYSIVQ